MQIREYELGSKVHQDGIGTLYNADNTDTAERAYLKLLDEAHANDPALVNSFHQCAELCCSLENKNQLQTLAHGQEKGWHYIILEYSDFRPMEGILRDHSFVSVAETVSFIERLAVNLRTYHLDGLVHGHLTPKNIFVDLDFTQVKLSDFGFEPLVRLLFQRKPKFLADSIPYYAPEVKTSTEPVQRYTDIFSIGVLFYKLLLNELPGTTLGLGNDSLNSEDKIVIPPSLQRLEIPELLDQLILSALETDPGKRCQNLSQFINKLYEAKSIIAQAAGTLVPSGVGHLNLGSTSLHIGQPNDGQETLLAKWPTEGGNETSGHAPNDHGDLTEEIGKRASSSDSQEASTRECPFEDQPNRALAEDGAGPSADQESDSHRQNQYSLKPPADETGSNGFDALTQALLGGNSNGNGHHGKNGNGETSTKGLNLSSDQDRTNGSRPINESEKGHQEKASSEFRRDLTPATGSNRETPMDGSAKGQVTSEPTMGDADSQLMDIFETKEKNHRHGDEYVNDTDPLDLDDFSSDVDENDHGPMATQTTDFLSTDSINMYRPKVAYGSVWTKSRLLMFVVLPMMVLAIVAVIAFDSDWFKGSQAPETMLETKSSIPNTLPEKPTQEVPKADLGKSPEPMKLKSDASTQNAARTATRPRSSGNVGAKAPAINGEKPTTRSGSINAALSPPIRKPETFIPRPKPQKSTPLSAITAAAKANSALLGKPAPETASLSQSASALLKVHVKHAQTPQKASIFLDGKLMGQSDANGLLTIPELKTDRAYLVKVESMGFAMWAKEIQFKKPGYNHLHVGLKSLAAVQKRGAPQATPLLQKGKVTVILANPNEVRYAFIYVNGQLWKDSIAPADLELPEGKYVLEARRDGFRCDPPSRTINVVQGQSSSVRFYLNREQAGL